MITLTHDQLLKLEHHCDLYDVDGYQFSPLADGEAEYQGEIHHLSMLVPSGDLDGRATAEGLVIELDADEGKVWIRHFEETGADLELHVRPPHQYVYGYATKDHLPPDGDYVFTEYTDLGKYASKIVMCYNEDGDGKWFTKSGTEKYTPDRWYPILNLEKLIE